MAKKEEVKNSENKNVVADAVTADNIMDVCEKRNIETGKNFKNYIGELEDEKNERLDKMKRDITYKATYRSELELVRLRHKRREMDIAKYSIRQSGRLLRFVIGFEVDDKTLEYASTPDDLFGKETVDAKNKTITIKFKDGDKTFKMGETVPACIDIVDYDELSGKLREEVRKRNNVEDKTFNTEVNKLDLSYGKYYSSDWRY